MVKYYGRAKMRIGAVNTNQISFNLSGTGSSVGARTRYTKKRVCNNLKVCGDVHYQGRIWSNNQKKDGKCGSCLPATTTCPTAGGVGRINAPRLLCGNGNNYKNNESATFNIITTKIRRVIIGDNTQNLGLATITGNDPVEFGLKNIKSIDPDISPANFSINKNTGMLKFINSNLNSKKFKLRDEEELENDLPMTVIELTITATKNNGDSREKTIVLWEGNDGLYNEDVSLNRDNCYTGNTDTQVIYYYLEDSDTLSVNYSLPQEANPESVIDDYEDFARAFSSILVDNQGNAKNMKIQSVSGTRGNKLETQVTIENNSIKEIQQTVGGDKMSVCNNLANWGINVKENETVFSGNILNESELKIKINHIREKLSLDTNSINQSTGTIKPNSILASTLNCIGQRANGYLSHGRWNPYINAGISGADGKPPINGQDIRTRICRNHYTTNTTAPCSPYMNFIYGWVWGLGDHYPSTYQDPLNPNFSDNLTGAPNEAPCTGDISFPLLFPEANNFAVGGSTFLSTTPRARQDPITPNLKGGDAAPNGETVPLRSPLVIRAFYFDNDNGDTTAVLVPGRCEFISLNSQGCAGPYTGDPPTPLSCSTSDLPQKMAMRNRGLPVFNNLLNYILDPTSTMFDVISSGVEDDSDDSDDSDDYDTVEIENKTLCIMACATQGQVSQDNIQNVPPPKWYVFNAGLFDNEPDVTLFLEGYNNFKNLDQGAARGTFVGEFDASGLENEETGSEDKSLINAQAPSVLGQEFLGCQAVLAPNGNTVYETWGEADIKLADDKKSVTIDYKTITEFGDGSGGITSRDEKEIGSQTISAI